MPGAAIVMRDRTTCDMPFTAAYWHNNNRAIISSDDKQTQEAQLLLGDRATRKHGKDSKWTWK